MVSLFERLFGRSNQADKSGKMAKDRLQFVLVQDRINLPAEKMQQMQKEILDVISKYVAVDLDNVDFELSNRDRNGVLIAEIPFGKMSMSTANRTPSQTRKPLRTRKRPTISDEDNTGDLTSRTNRRPALPRKPSLPLRRPTTTCKIRPFRVLVTRYNRRSPMFAIRSKS